MDLSILSDYVSRLCGFVHWRQSTADTGREAGYTRNRSPAHHRANTETHINTVCVPAETGETCKLTHKKDPVFKPTGALLLWHLATALAPPIVNFSRGLIGRDKLKNIHVDLKKKGN